MPIDYSKWKDIEVSDDEDDTHPNIDTPSLFRWRHQARLERMADKKMAKEEIERDKSQTNSKITELTKKLDDATVSEGERKQIEEEIAKIKEQEEEFKKKEKELADKERLEPWNVDTIGTVKMDKTRINKIGEKKIEPRRASDEDGKEMFKYFDKHESSLEKFAALSGLDASEAFLLDNPLLASENAVNWMTIEALNAAIEEKETRMTRMAEQCVVIQYLLELSKTLRAEPTNTNFIKNFFKKFRAADESYLKVFRDEVSSFHERLRIRAKQKRDEAVADYEKEEKEKRIQNAPGGLDPQEVYESLPLEMREAFDSREVGRLQEVAAKMDEEVFSYHLKRCIDSGLWVPGGAGEEEESVAADDEHLHEPSTSQS